MAMAATAQPTTNFVEHGFRVELTATTMLGLTRQGYLHPTLLGMRFEVALLGKREIGMDQLREKVTDNL